MSSRDKIRKLRLSEKNNINNRNRELGSFITRKQKTIHRMKQGDVTEFIAKKIRKLQDEIDNHNNEITNNETRIENLERGNLDEELLAEFTETKKIQEEKASKKREKKAAVEAYKKEKKAISQQYYQEEREYGRNQRRKGWEMKKSEKYFFNVVDSLPDYMKKNLKNMPANKGYVWRGVYFYGELPYVEGQVRQMYEKSKGQLYIHEFSDDGWYRKYLQQTKQETNNRKGKSRGKNRGGRPKKIKTLISEEFRKRLS